MNNYFSNDSSIWSHQSFGVETWVIIIGIIIVTIWVGIIVYIINIRKTQYNKKIKDLICDRLTSSGIEKDKALSIYTKLIIPNGENKKNKQQTLVNSYNTFYNAIRKYEGLDMSTLDIITKLQNDDTFKDKINEEETNISNLTKFVNESRENANVYKNECVWVNIINYIIFFTICILVVARVSYELYMLRDKPTNEYYKLAGEVILAALVVIMVGNWLSLNLNLPSLITGSIVLFLIILIYIKIYQSTKQVPAIKEEDVEKDPIKVLTNRYNVILKKKEELSGLYEIMKQLPQPFFNQQETLQAQKTANKLKEEQGRRVVEFIKSVQNLKDFDLDNLDTEQLIKGTNYKNVSDITRVYAGDNKVSETVVDVKTAAKNHKSKS